MLVRGPGGEARTNEPAPAVPAPAPAPAPPSKPPPIGPSSPPPSPPRGRRAAAAAAAAAAEASSPEDIRSLSPGQLATLKTDLAAEMAAAKERRATPSWQLVLRVLRGRYAPLIAVIHVIAGFVSSIFIYWSPVIIMSLLQGSALTPQAAAGSSAKGSLPAVGLSTVPAVVAAVSCVATAAHAQRSKELFMHASLPLLGAGVVTSFFPLLTRAHPAAGFVALVLTLALALAANPSISSILALLYKGPAEVVALPLFDAVLTAGAVIGAPLSGLIVQRSSSGFTWVTVMMGLLICTSSALLGVLAVWVAHGEQAEDLMLRPRRRFRLVSQSGSGGGGDGGGAAESVPKAAAAAATAV
ncbi:tartrate transporter [Raphidocelis subcapitata]|uniref:Tartrate transporter n=1 Tax=Raphidocelis subcapitata TaxID=307507 RepID=A0A2V0NLY4_9CHLO|nr:tartrate transporter [Raphidocelis subcapitata]|eukprot:GBF88149.1 tartrate transporter [Raphidocelis subcapitata]